MQKETQSQFKRFQEGRSLKEFMAADKKELWEEFQTLGHVCSSTEYEDKLYKPNKKQEQLNRYSNVLPYEHNRVTHKGNYLNASHMKLISAGECRIIACQAPVKPYSAFWQAALENNVGLVIMLCAFKDQRGTQAERYWPERGTSFTENNIKVEADKEVKELLPKFEERQMIVTGGDKEKKVRHIHWHGWQDFGVPSASSFQTVKLICDIFIEHINKQQGIVIHCSAGIGRTGTMIAIIDALRIIQADPNANLSIFNLVYNLRLHRFGSVQTFEQYQFIYEFVRECIRRKDSKE